MKLGDFGLPAVPATRGSLLKGTTKYMAPELSPTQFGPVGPASDLYSLGFSAYELMCGASSRRCFPGWQFRPRQANRLDDVARRRRSQCAAHPPRAGGRARRLRPGRSRPWSSRIRRSATIGEGRARDLRPAPLAIGTRRPEAYAAAEEARAAAAKKRRLRAVRPSWP